MALAFVRNMRTHDIQLNGGDASFTIPAGTQGPEGFAPGTASVEDSFIDAVKKTVAGAAFFDAGFLTVEKSAKPAKGE